VNLINRNYSGVELVMISKTVLF